MLLLTYGEYGYNTVARNISLIIYLISCKMIVTFENFPELCIGVAHSDDNT
ncbi:hypothetical protein SAMN05216383_11832 [Prevotella sp. KH2C16]|nr:hypothetical protein SAMN05216383_11832 [Prevotella sp. KH2C16]